MRVLFDTNVVLDLMLDREPFALSAAQLFSKVETKELSGFLGATTVTTIHYLASKAVGAKRAQSEVTKLLVIVHRKVAEAAEGYLFFAFR